MRWVESAAVTDRGKVRSRNEDAYWKGNTAFAVADGMGGHLAGDVASATALLPVRALDDKEFPDSASAQAALLDAILAANAAVVRKAADEPSFYGMGTTLTATLVEDDRLHVAHVGDSRAYLLRDEHFTQLTRDHTLVAHLIEEGQITKEEAAVHPQRSIITRAIGVDVDLDVDTLSIELEDGDQVMLCSDGLTGPVSDEEIGAILNAEMSAQEAAEALVDLAKEHGGPDNITVVLIRYHEDDGRGNGRGPTTRIRSDTPESSEVDWARTLGRIGALGQRSERHLEEPTKGSRLRRAALAGLVVVVLLAVAALAGLLLLRRSYFLGVDGDRVAIYQGAQASVGPLRLSRVVERTDHTVTEFPDWYVQELQKGVGVSDPVEGRRTIEEAPRREPPPPRAQPPAPPPPGPSQPGVGPGAPPPGPPEGRPVPAGVIQPARRDVPRPFGAFLAWAGRGTRR